MANTTASNAFHWGGTPTPQKTPTPDWTGSARTRSYEIQKNRPKNSGNAGAKVVSSPVNADQERAMQTIKKLIAEGNRNPSSNALLGGENKVALRNPYSPYTITYTGNPYSPYSITLNNTSLNQASNVPVSYQGIGKDTGLNAQQNQALTYNGMGDLQLLNYYQSLLNEPSAGGKKTYGSYSPVYYGGWGGYGGGGYGGSYSPFDFFFNLLNWRI